MSVDILSNISLCEYQGACFVRADARSGNLHPSPVETFWYPLVFESAAAAKATLLAEKIMGGFSTKSSLQHLPTIPEHALTSAQREALDSLLSQKTPIPLEAALAKLTTAGCDTQDPLGTLLAEAAINALREGQDAWPTSLDGALPVACSITQAGLPEAALQVLENPKDLRTRGLIDEKAPLGVSLVHRIVAEYLWQPEHIQGCIRSLKALAARGYPMNGRNAAGRTPLQVAAGATRPPAEVITLLVKEMGASLLAVDADNRSALHLAAARGNAEAVDLLIRLLSQQYRHADVLTQINAIDRWGNTPLTLACLSSGEEAAVTLLQRGANANAVNRDGDGPLHLVAQSRYKTRVAQALVAAGADLTAVDCVGRRPVEIAAAYVPTEAGQVNPVHDFLEAAMREREFTQPLRDARFHPDGDKAGVWTRLALGTEQQTHSYEAAVQVGQDLPVLVSRTTRSPSSESTVELGRYPTAEAAVQAYLTDLAALNQQQAEEEPVAQSDAPRG